MPDFPLSVAEPLEEADYLGLMAWLYRRNLAYAYEIDDDKTREATVARVKSQLSGILAS